MTLTLINCSNNATSQPVYIVFDTWNTTEYARIVLLNSGWAIQTGDFVSANEKGFSSAEAAFERCKEYFRQEAMTP